MDFETCPDWICNHNGIPCDYVYFLTGILISIPYLILVRYLYKKIALNTSKKRRYLFFLAIPIGYIAYCSLIFFAFLDSKYKILDFIAIVAAVPAMTLVITIPIAIIGMIIVMFMNFDK